ncbi:PREDICTED: uncharacterized protein LOC109461562 [Branchiostoma belcheri]|uniref:Uncharacterized protein LOC109461562 n=1 Tax=Branchiostoma belcheri TaxID=7741 RepID=A0A6P4Y499_BRABE|nr:PREDICTED: uncharacterized protein LOC109461562 [Branchiostoma belcheri]
MVVYSWACVCCIAIAALSCSTTCRQHDWDALNGMRAMHYKTFDCTPASIGLHAVNIFLAVLELILGFVVSILSCCGLCTMRRPAAQTVIYAAGPVPGGAEGNIVIMQGITGAQGSQPQMFLAQNPGAAGAPVQVFYPAQQAPPAYQVDPGAASGAHDEKKGPLPAGSVFVMACAYEPRVVRGLGWTLVVLGCLSVTLGVAADIAFADHRTPFHFFSAPVWSGLLVLTAGILGILSAKKPTNKCLVVAFLVVGVIVIVMCVLCIAFAALGIVLNHHVPHLCGHFDWDAYNATRALNVSYPNPFLDPKFGDYQTFDCTPHSIGLHAVNIFLALLEIILGFVVSILSCCEMCTIRRLAAQVGTADGTLKLRH